MIGALHKSGNAPIIIKWIHRGDSGYLALGQGHGKRYTDCTLRTLETSMTLAIHNLLNDKTRLVLSVGGVALAVMLILILNGFLTGMNSQITSYLVHAPGTIVVTQVGIRNMLGATSLLPPGAAAEVEAINGVSQEYPVLSQFIILDLH